jgi:hypothetical protein
MSLPVDPAAPKPPASGDINVNLKPESLPLEGSRDTGEGILISIYPDVCLTPVGGVMVAIPYTIYAYQSDDANTAATVRQTSLRSHTSASIITHCYGDEAGTGGGVTSGTHNSICEPKTWSPTVRFEGHGAVRHQDEWWMNKRNTIGKLTYIKDQKEYKSIQLAFLASSPSSTSDAPAPFSAPAVNASPAAPTPAPAAETPEVPETQPARSRGAPSSLPVDGGTMGFIEMTGNQLGPYIVGSFVVPHDINELQSVLDTPSTPPLTAEQRQIIQSAIDDIKKNDLPTYDYGASGAKKKDALARAKLSRQAKAETSGAVRTTGRERKKCNCIVGAYKDIKEKCADANCNGQAHHAVPDYTLRYGTREEGQGKSPRKRIAGMPSFEDGVSVCLEGGAKDDGSAHWEAHGADGAIAKLGETSATPGTAPIGKIISLATAQTESAMGDDEACKELLRKLVAKSFVGVDRNAPGRTTLQPPKEGTPAYYALSGVGTNQPK